MSRLIPSRRQSLCKCKKTRTHCSAKRQPRHGVNIDLQFGGWGIISVRWANCHESLCIQEWLRGALFLDRIIFKIPVSVLLLSSVVAATHWPANPIWTFTALNTALISKYLILSYLIHWSVLYGPNRSSFSTTYGYVQVTAFMLYYSHLWLYLQRKQCI